MSRSRARSPLSECNLVVLQRRGKGWGVRWRGAGCKLAPPSALASRGSSYTEIISDSTTFPGSHLTNRTWPESRQNPHAGLAKTTTVIVSPECRQQEEDGAADAVVGVEGPSIPREEQ